MGFATGDWEGKAWVGEAWSADLMEKMIVIGMETMHYVLAYLFVMKIIHSAIPSVNITIKQGPLS